jgi:hypothetical protein
MHYVTETCKIHMDTVTRYAFSPLKRFSQDWQAEAMQQRVISSYIFTRSKYRRRICETS